MQDQWKQYADKIAHQYQDVVRQYGELNEEQQRFNMSVDRSIFTEVNYEWRTQQLEHMKEGWNKIFDNFERYSTTRETIQMIKKLTIDRSRIDAQQLRDTYRL